MSAARTHYGRVILFQERSGFVVDLGPRSVLATATPGTTEEVLIVEGTELVISRSFSLSIPLVESHVIDALRVMERIGCDTRAIMLGGPGAVSYLWHVDGSKLAVTDVNRGAKTFSGARAELTSRIFQGAIYQDSNIIGGIPFECTHTETVFASSSLGCGSGSGGFFDGGSGFDTDYALRSFGASHYVGPYWSPDSSDMEVSASGVPNFGSGSQVILQMTFPAQGATLKLSGDATFAVFFYDWQINGVGGVAHNPGFDVEYTVPSNTWRMDVVMQDPTLGKPIVECANPGPAVAPRYGECIDCGNPLAVVTTTPSWFT